MAFGAAVARAQDEQPPMPQGPPQRGQGMRMQMPSFADLDKNKDKKISRDEFQGPAQFFDRLDENKDGAIDEEEFNRMRQRMDRGGGGPNLGERFSRFMDADKNGSVSREEFARVTQLFDALDQDKNGELTQEEMARFFQAMSEVQTQATGGVEVNNLFTRFDKDKDGKLIQAEIGDERTFKALDLNKDGSVTKEEAEEALKKLEAARKAKQQNPPQN